MLQGCGCDVDALKGRRIDEPSEILRFGSISFNLELRGPIAITRLKQVAFPGFADSRLRRLRRGSFCKRRPWLQPDEHLRSRLDAGEINLRTISVCARGHGRNFLSRLHLAALLGCEVPEAKK